MHTNLFLSLILNGVAVTVDNWQFKLNVLQQGSSGIIAQNSVECRVASVVNLYARTSTYMWMLCEGFYLHKLLVSAFAEEKRLYLYYVIGWVFPAIPVGVYSSVRVHVADEKCWWTKLEDYEWIIRAPMLTSLALNLVFLCNIIRILITKLQATCSNEPSQYRKAVRATLVLVPLFGLHFFLGSYVANHDVCSTSIDVYYYFNVLIDGLEGFFVSLIFCYFNGEVLCLLKRTRQRCRLRSDPSGGCSKASVTTTHVISLAEILPDKYANVLR